MRSGWLEYRKRRSLDMPILHEKKHGKKHVNEVLGR
jgi:hypothetical protein